MPVCETLVVDAHPNDAIREVMDSTQADLLVIGA
jgi:nucleotide-binding universal stress UspA family protein